MPKHGMSRLLKIVAAGIAALALVGNAFAADTEVVFGSPTPASVNLANITAAMELGYFAAEGIKPKLQVFQGTAITMTQAAVKSIAIAGGGPDPLVMTNQPGKSRLPLKFFYNGFRDYVWQFVVPPDSPIKTLADLKGKKIGVSSLTNGHVTVSKLILKEHGLGPTDAEFIPIGEGSAAFNALSSGRIDVYNTYNGNIAFFEANGAKLRRLPIPSSYSGIFTFGYFTHEDTVKQQPKILAGFARATAKGTIICEKATAWCVKNFWKYYPNLKPRGEPDAELARQVYILGENLKSYLAFPPGQPRRFGEFPKETWTTLIGALHQGGALSTDKVDPTSFYTNELIGQINDFDVKAIEAQAAMLK